jgi:hypothetical protein
MSKTASNRIRSFRTLVAAAVCFALTATSGLALAAQSTPGTPSVVEYNGSNTQLYITINGVFFIGQTGAPGCGGTSQSVETLKVWTSMAEAALLSGKKLLVWYDTGGVCGSNKYIASLQIQA